MNTTFNKGIGVTPAETLFGYQLRQPAEANLLAEVSADNPRLELATVRKKIQSHITEDQAKQKLYYNKARREADRYKVGDVVLVLIITSAANTGSSKKLFPKFKSPFKVVKELFNDRYQVEDLREGHRKSVTVVSVEKLKPWVTAQA